MGTSTPGLAHAIATRHPGRVAPDPRGVSVGAPRPAASRWQFRGGRSPGSRVNADHLAFPVCPVASLGIGSPLTVAGAATAWANAAPCSRHRHASELRGAFAERKRVAGALASASSERAKRKRIGSDRDDPSQGVQRQPAVSSRSARRRESPTGASPDDRPRQGCAADRRRRWLRTRPWAASPRPARRPRVRRGAADRPRPPPPATT